MYPCLTVSLCLWNLFSVCVRILILAVCLALLFCVSLSSGLSPVCCFTSHSALYAFNLLSFFFYLPSLINNKRQHRCIKTMSGSGTPKSQQVMSPSGSAGKSSTPLTPSVNVSEEEKQTSPGSKQKKSKASDQEDQEDQEDSFSDESPQDGLMFVLLSIGEDKLWNQLKSSTIFTDQKLSLLNSEELAEVFKYEFPTLHPLTIKAVTKRLRSAYQVHPRFRQPETDPSDNAVAATTSTSNSQTTVVNNTMGLYGNQDKVSATLPSLKALPTNADYDIFEEWRKVAINSMVNTGGMVHVVTESHSTSLALAISSDSSGRSPAAIKQLWKTLHLKACSVLKEALRPALKDTPGTEAEQEQARRPSEFIEGNANWLWKFASKQFIPDRIGKTIKGLKILQSLHFKPGVTTPSEYNTVFRAAINDICAAIPAQKFSEEFKLAYYLAGWPTELNQNLALLKSEASPTLERAQQHLQQWYNDHGKKIKSLDTFEHPRKTFAAFNDEGQETQAEKKPCYHFVQHGKCRYGKKCHYSHNVTVTGTSNQNNSEDERPPHVDLG